MPGRREEAGHADEARPPSAPSTGGEAADPEDRFRATVARLPPRLRHYVARWESLWPGRIAVRCVAAFVRVELFDRSMSIAAQFFTSIFPLVIAISSWLGGDRVAASLDLSDETRSVVDDALQRTTDSPTFGVIGFLFVLVSATSLSRALTRAFAAIWGLQRPTISLTSAWRWVAVVLALILALVAARSLDKFLRVVPPPTLWEVLAALAFDVAVAVFVPLLLLSGRIRVRELLPGAALFGIVMLLVRPASHVWLPEALLFSAQRYGSIGVAFTYLAWLYVLAFCLLSSSVVGQVLATDTGPLGRWAQRGPREG